MILPFSLAVFSLSAACTHLFASRWQTRQVGYGLREGLAGEGVPAFRVVNGKGELSGARYFPSSDLQQSLLADEGVPSRWNGRCWQVDLKAYGWKTTQKDISRFAKAFASGED